MDNFPLNLPAPTAPTPSSPLTALAERFVEHWVRFRNATQAYRYASPTDVTYGTAAVEGRRLLNDARVQELIKATAKAAYADTTVTTGWLLQRFLDIANADPRELIGLKVGCCRYCYGEGGRYQWREREYLEALEHAERQAAEGAQGVRYPDPAGGFGFNPTLVPRPECEECRGEGVERFVPRDTDNLSDEAMLLYGGVKVKKDGYEIIIADRNKALELAGRMIGAFNDKLRVEGQVGIIAAAADLRKMDPQEASRAYRGMIAGKLAIAD